MGLALLPTSVIPLGGRIKGVVVRHGAHALPWDSLSRGRGLHSGAPVSLSLMAATGFHTSCSSPVSGHGRAVGI